MRTERDSGAQDFWWLTIILGASVLTKKKPNAAKTGQWIIIGGLAIQLIFFGFFMIVSFVFHSRVNSNPTSRSESPNVPWRKHMWALYAGSLLIMIRSVFRLVEYVQGSNGYLMRNEVWLYIFDALLMFLTMALFNIIHPSEVKGMLRGRKAARWIVRMQTMKKVSEIEGITTSQKGVPQAFEHRDVANTV